MRTATDPLPGGSELERRAYADLPHSACAFPQWIRMRLFEHWSGARFWSELDRDDFGILCRPIHPNRTLVDDVVALLVTGGENLTILTWAIETDRPLDDVVAILTLLDVNARRLARFAWLPATPRSSPPFLRLVSAC